MSFCGIQVLASDVLSPQREPIIVYKKSAYTDVNMAWFYFDVLPCILDNTSFLLASISKDEFETIGGKTQAGKLISPQWITIWQVNNNSSSRLAGLRIGNFDFVYQIPQIVADKGDVYLFFFTGAKDIQPSSPVLRRSPGGWCWQTLDTVETAIRHRANFTDLMQGKVFDGTGRSVADISEVKAQFKESSQLVCFESNVGADFATGLLGKPLKYDKERPPLPYETLYFYSIKANRENKVMKLNFVREDKAPDTDTPTLASKAVPGLDDVVTYGKPVTDGKRILYWYCIHQKDKPTYRVYILACYDGEQTFAIDGYIVNPPYVRYWKDNTWVKEQRQLVWTYQQQLGLPVQPIVGKDANGKIISYRPPELWQLEFVPEASAIPPTTGTPTAGANMK